MNPVSMIFAGCGLLLLPVLSFGSNEPTVANDTASASAPARYVGQKQCKNCHADEKTGGVHQKWAASGHAKAFEILGSPEAKKIAGEMKIDDPQKSEKCLPCHQTAYGVDEKKEIKRGFKAEDGVQCETCHGPGEDHVKARMKAAMKGEEVPVEEGEIKVGRDPQICLKCHNDKSPTYEDFCFKERMAEIAHLNPTKERSEEELKKLRDMCLPDCEKCKKDK